MLKMRSTLLLLAITSAAGPRLKAQIQPGSAAASGVALSLTSTPSKLIYAPPTEATKFNNYLFDSFGPYPIVSAAFEAGLDQAGNSPPDWGQGARGYGKRFGSEFGMAAVSTTTRYALGEAFREDTLYYRCDCKGFFPRLDHALLSTFISRRGEDGHRVFSFPALIGPYAGSMTAVYAWYPDRYNAKDAFRIGNYNLLEYVGGNIALEFLYSGPHSILSRVHLNNRHGALGAQP